MKIRTIEDACEALLNMDYKTSVEEVPIWEAYGRVLAAKMEAEVMVPSFYRSAYDGYALHSEDTANASKERPVVLEVTETIPAGAVAKYPVNNGQAVRIMTGAATPEGVDAVIMHEKTEFTDSEVKIFAPVKPGNIVEIGEDVQKGDILATEGKVLGSADVAWIAGQGIDRVQVYKRPRAALISTGSELVLPGQPLVPGKIYNTNPYLLAGYIRKCGMEPVNYGIVKDEIDLLASAMEHALEECDMLITTGGVSAGDYDFVSLAAEKIGAEILFHRISMKPGGAMLAAVKDGKLILGLSGNPGAAAVGMLRVGWPAMKKICGIKDFKFEEVKVEIKEAFPKPAKSTRILRGKVEFSDGNLQMQLIDNQRNGSVSSMVDCDILAEIPEGTESVEKGEKLRGFMI